MDLLIIGFIAGRLVASKQLARLKRSPGREGGRADGRKKMRKRVSTREEQQRRDASCFSARGSTGGGTGGTVTMSKGTATLLSFRC